MQAETTELAVKQIQNQIVRLESRPPVMLTRDLAEVYQVTPRQITGAVKRHPDRFPEDFVFELTPEERGCMQNAYNLSEFAPMKIIAFTRLGANMLSAVLRSKVAAERSVLIMRAFSAMEEQGRIPPESPPHQLYPLVIQLLSEDRISRMALKPDGTTTISIKKPSPAKATKAESSLKDLCAKALAIIKKRGSPSAREVQRYIGRPIEVTREALDLLAQEGIIARRISSGYRGPKTTRYFLRKDSW